MKINWEQEEWDKGALSFGWSLSSQDHLYCTLWWLSVCWHLSSMLGIGSRAAHPQPSWGTAAGYWGCNLSCSLWLERWGFSCRLFTAEYLSRGRVRPVLPGICTEKIGLYVGTSVPEVFFPHGKTGEGLLAVLRDRICLRNSSWSFWHTKMKFPKKKCWDLSESDPTRLVF